MVPVPHYVMALIIAGETMQATDHFNPACRPSLPHLLAAATRRGAPRRPRILPCQPARPSCRRFPHLDYALPIMGYYPPHPHGRNGRAFKGATRCGSGPGHGITTFW